MRRVIPDPEVKRFDLSPATERNGDGDLFIIIASDGGARIDTHAA